MDLILYEYKGPQLQTYIYIMILMILSTCWLVDIFDSGLTVKLFADDVKMYVIINDVNNSVLLQERLDALMHGETFGNCLFLYKNALFYILIGMTQALWCSVAFGSIGHGFESEDRLFSNHSASAFSKLRSLAKCSLDDSVHRLL